MPEISMGTAVMMIITGLVCLAVPVVSAILLHRRKGANVMPFFIGCIIFIVFSQVLEKLLHSVVLKSTFITGNLWAYVIYGGLAAGVFEEVGRWVAFRFLIKKRRPENALMYGIGHGGIEAILLLVLNMFTYGVISIMVANGQVSTVAAMFGGTANAQTLLGIITAYTPGLILWSLFERLVAMTLHVGLSIGVYAGVVRRKPVYLIAAIGVHAFVDAVVLLIHNLIGSYLVTELTCAVMTAVVFYFALRLYRSLKKEQLAATAAVPAEVIPQNED